jgi:hypothetical protein
MLTAIARRRRQMMRRDRADLGVSLIELVVAMGLMTVIGAMTLAFFISMNTADSRTVDANISTAGARNALETWTRLLTVADSSQTAALGTGRFQQITPTTAIFYANMNSNRASTSAARTAPTKVFLSLEGGQLVERDYAPLSSIAPSTYPGSPTQTRYLASDVVISGWLFTPYVVGSAPSISEPNDCTAGAAGLCAGVPEADAILPTIVRVDIAFTVAPASGGSQSFSSSAAITGGTT